MISRVGVSSAIALAAITTSAWSAEDHSAHQAPAAEDHSHHHPAVPANESDTRTESERAHVPPAAPQHIMGEMSNARMIELMQMEDDASVASIMLDELEHRGREAQDAQAWDLQAWYGDDYNKLWLKTAGEVVSGDAGLRAELLWDRIVTKWWNLQAGVAQDYSTGPTRTWGVVGVQGIAPYFFETEAALYVGEAGRISVRVSSEYDMLITQRLVLQPEFEVRWFSDDDLDNRIGAGVSSVEIGVRLRYELRREIAPYVGVLWERHLGATADLARADGEETSELMWVAGIRAWY